MSAESIKAYDASQASAIRNAGFAEDVHLSGEYFIECRDRDGNLKWSDKIENLVTTIGKNTLLNTMFGGIGDTAKSSWYIGLIGATGYTTGAAVTDTMASHAGWAEDTNYSQATRILAYFAAASAGEKQLNEAVAFSISASTTIKGCFLVNNSTKGGTTNILYSAGVFTNGDKILDSGDALSVTYKART